MTMLQGSQRIDAAKPQLQGSAEEKQEDCAMKRVDLVAEAGTEAIGGERLKRHRREMAGRVWIPETWGQEKLLKEWSDCTSIDRSLFPAGLLLAREALVGEYRRAGAGRIRVVNSC